MKDGFKHFAHLHLYNYHDTIIHLYKYISELVWIIGKDLQ